MNILENRDWLRIAIRNPVLENKLARKSPEYRKTMRQKRKDTPECEFLSPLLKPLLDDPYLPKRTRKRIIKALTTVEIHHKKSVSEYPHLAANYFNLITLNKKIHRQYIHPLGFCSYIENIDEAIAWNQENLKITITKAFTTPPTKRWWSFGIPIYSREII